MKINTQAYQKYIRQSPRKVRLIVDLVRGMAVDEALEQLTYTPKKAAEVVGKVIRQAQANAINNHQAKPSTLVISDIQVTEGPRLKRWRPVSRGRAHGIIKRMSHVKVTVSGEANTATS